MSDQGIRYTYDGTFEGYLCAVLAALRSGRVPAAIADRRRASGTDDAFNIITNLKDAQYLYSTISARSSAEVQQMASDYFLTDSRDLEINLYKMIFCALKYGAGIAEDYSSVTMNGIQMAIRDLYREAQSELAQIDFYLGEEAACAMIDPKNSILPLIRPSILKRRELDSLIVYDKSTVCSLRDPADRICSSTYPISRYPNSGIRRKHMISCGLLSGISALM